VDFVPFLIGSLIGQAPSFVMFPYIGSMSKDLLDAFFSDEGVSSLLGKWGTVAWFVTLGIANILITIVLAVVAKRELKKIMIEAEETLVVDVEAVHHEPTPHSEASEHQVYAKQQRQSTQDYNSIGTASS
jgi:hypothetical protein